ELLLLAFQISHFRACSKAQLRRDLIQHRFQVDEVHQQIMQECRTQTGDDVKIQETFGPPDVLQHTAEHPEGKHIEEQMTQTAVHEQVGYGLPQFKFTGTRKTKAE